MDSYTDDDVVRFEYEHQQRTAGKLRLIRERFGLSEIRFLQIVNAVLDDPARVAALDPAVAALARRLDVQRQHAAAIRRPA